MSAAPVHWSAQRRDRLFAGAACDAAGGKLSEDGAAVTCPACLRAWRDAHTPALPGFTVPPPVAVQPRYVMQRLPKQGGPEPIPEQLRRCFP